MCLDWVKSRQAEKTIEGNAHLFRFLIYYFTL